MQATNPAHDFPRTYSRWIWGVLLLALGLRLIYVLGLSPLNAYLIDGGDTVWYLINGIGLTSGKVAGRLWVAFEDQYYVLPFLSKALPTPPLYLYLVGWWQMALPPAAAITGIWGMQAVMGTAVCWFGYRVGRRIHSEAAGLIAAFALAINPELIREAGHILTESSYIFFVFAAIWLYVDYVVPQFALNERPRWPVLLLIGAVFGLGTLTRAVLLLFPVGIALHMLLISRARWWRSTLVLLAAYGLMIGTWTAHNWVLYQRFVIVSDQFTPAFWRGAVTTDGAPHENDAQLEGTTPGEAAVEAIADDFGGYIALRVRELADAYLTPAGTTTLGGESLRQLVTDWWRNDRTLAGLGTVTQGDHFWLKALMYGFHFGGILLGLAGMWFARRRWQVMTVLGGFILYTTLLHSVLIALPRYVFPTQIAFWMLASVPLAMLWQKARQPRA